MVTTTTSSGPVRRTPTLSRSDWVDAALAMLAEGDDTAVRIDALATRLGVTKGSFYWHFKDRAALVDAVIDRWGEIRSPEVVASYFDTVVDPMEKFRLLTHSMGRFYPVERAIRSWAASDRAAAEAVRRNDQASMDMITAVFEQLGFDRADAEVRARLVVLALVGSFSLGVDIGELISETGLAREIELLTRQP